MEPAPKPDLAQAFAAASDWWRDAGVDCDFADAPHAWLTPCDPAEAQPAAASAARPAPAAPPGPPDRSDWPHHLDAFAAWWLAAPWLDGGRTAGRVPPRGAAAPALMVLVPQPEAGDGDTLLAGPQGRLLAAMLAAMGVAEDRAYIASVLPRHTPHADWEVAAQAGLGEVLRRHVALVAPARLIAFGASILPLIGHDPAKNAAPYGNFNHEGGTVPLLAARDLALLLERPRWKAQVWRSWLEWPAGTRPAAPMEMRET